MTTANTMTPKSALEYAKKLSSSLAFPFVVQFSGLTSDAEPDDQGTFKQTYLQETIDFIIESNQDWAEVYISSFEEIDRVKVEPFEGSVIEF